MRSSRLLSILLLLQLRQRLTAEALAAEFEVSVRTIYRDVDALMAAGVPVDAERGPGGGFSLTGGYRTRLTGLAGDEAEALWLVGRPAVAAELGLGAAANRASVKLLGALSEQLRPEVDRVAACFHIDPIDWYREVAPVVGLPRLARAVLDRRLVRMRYRSWNAVGERRVAPLGLVQKAGAWYLVGRGERAIRIYKVASIEALEVEAVGFARPPDFDLARWWQGAIARFEADLRPLGAVVRLAPEAQRKLAEQGAYAARAVAAGTVGRDGWRRIALPIESIVQAVPLLLGLGGDLCVIRPAALRRALRETARRIADLQSPRLSRRRALR